MNQSHKEEIALKILARELAFKALFQLDFNNDVEEDKDKFEEFAINNVIQIDSDDGYENDETYEKCTTEGNVTLEKFEGLHEENHLYINKVVKGTMANLNEIDEIISNHLKKGWSIQRLATVDRNILRLSVYELKFDEDSIPKGIIINEAVEIAKKYGTDTSGRFVNGILAAIAN